MKYYVIAGEASGDLHGSNLILEIKKKDDQAIFRGWGGETDAEAGAEIVKNYRDLAFMVLLKSSGTCRLYSVISGFASQIFSHLNQMPSYLSTTRVLIFVLPDGLTKTIKNDLLYLTPGMGMERKSCKIDPEKYRQNAGYPAL